MKVSLRLTVDYTMDVEADSIDKAIQKANDNFSEELLENWGDVDWGFIAENNEVTLREACILALEENGGDYFDEKEEYKKISRESQEQIFNRLGELYGFYVLDQDDRAEYLKIDIEKIKAEYGISF